MTNEELQTVVSAVIQALKTNGKTIDQLTPVTSLANSDSLEVSGGKKIAFSKLKELVASAVVVTEESIKSWVVIESTDALPVEPTTEEQMKAYVLADKSTLYVYVGEGGDTLNGSYQSVIMKGADGNTGPKGDSGVSLGDVVLVNDLTTGGEVNALSAEMGKIIRENVEAIFNSLGEYAFPNGKPAIEWSGQMAHVYLTLSDYTSSNSATSVRKGESYSTILTPTELGNLYTRNVVVKMNDVDITAIAYDENTGVVSIQEVMGSIDITATQETYEQDGLVLHLDGLNRGSNVGHWVDLVNHFDFELQGAFVENSDNIDLQGSSYASVSSVGAYLTGVSTLEVIINQKSTMQPQEYQAIAMSACKGGISIGTTPGQNGNMAFSAYAKAVDHSIVGGLLSPYLDDEYTSNAIHSISRFGGNTIVDGFSKTNASASYSNYPNSILNGDFILGGYLGGNDVIRAFNGKIYSVRLYNRVLTESEIKHNLKVDKLRFNF